MNYVIIRQMIIGGHMKTIKLKPCPFCGRKVKVQYYEIDTPVTFTECGYEICCCFCGIQFKERLSRMPQFDEKAEMKKQTLIERWNRRVNDEIRL